MSPALDQALSQLLGLGRHLPSLSVEGTLLAEARRHEVPLQRDRAQAELAVLAPLVVDRDLEAILAYDALVASAIDGLRRADPPGPRRLLSLLDRVSLLPRAEYCDDKTLPGEQRRAILAAIDWVNEGLQSYALWNHLLDQDLSSRNGRPTRVLDLAAGHAGFALALKEMRGDAISVTASDIFEEYLDLGREQARRRGLDVTFRHQDATNLAALAADSYDVIVCTQSIHHFSPGMVARMLGEAARIARRAVWFIDAERSLLGATLVGSVMAAHTRSWPPVHDTVVSLRKMYTEEELTLIGQLAPGLPPGCRVSAGRQRPGFVYLRVEAP